MGSNSSAANGQSSDSGGHGASSVIAALTELGFSQYEARTYTGLVGRQPMTGYALAKETRVPQPKVYETLGRLVESGAVLQVADSPAKFVAVPPARLIAQMDGDFRRRMGVAELELSKLQQRSSDLQPLRTYNEADSWVTIADAGVTLIGRASRRLYISGNADYLEVFREAVQQADRRGIRTDLLSFGKPPFDVANGSCEQHRSTERIVYPHHQARHLAITADEDGALWAMAPDGDNWEAIWAEHDALLCALVKGFIRHDLFMNRVFTDFSEQMIGQYGPGLSGLFEARPPAAATPPAPARRRGPRSA